jgi:hypothetical protein
MTRGPGSATAALLLLALAGTVRAEDAAPRVVRYANDALTVRLTNVPVNEVLDEISHQSGAEIHGQLAGARAVSADFDAVPLPEALHRLLGEENFALVYGDKGNLKAVKLLGEARITTAAMRASVTTTTVGFEPEEKMLDYLQQPIPIPAGSRVSRLIGAPTAPLRQVLETGLRAEDAATRADTVRAALQAIEGEPRIRAAVAQAMGNLDDASAAALLRGVAGDHADEIARLVAGQTKITALRNKANSFLGMLSGGQ